MKLTVLGCGQFYISSNYNTVGNLLQVDDTNILLDFGRGSYRALTSLDFSINDIDIIALTHFHPDHTADLLTALQVHFIEYKRKQTDKQITLMGPTGIKEWYENITKLMYDEIPYQPEIIELNNDSIKIKDIKISTQLMKHLIPNVAFKIEHHNKTLVYSGDTGMNNDIVVFSKQADLLMLECSSPIEEIVDFHLNPTTCGKIAEQAQVKQLVITHYGDESRVKEIDTETSKHYTGILIIAKESLEIDI